MVENGDTSYPTDYNVVELAGLSTDVLPLNV